MSAREGAFHAMKTWTHIAWKRDLGAYETSRRNAPTAIQTRIGPNFRFRNCCARLPRSHHHYRQSPRYRYAEGDVMLRKATKTPVRRIYAESELDGVLQEWDLI
jgi:hypothetical protein